MVSNRQLTWAVIILTVCLCLSHNTHTLKERRLSDQLQQIQSSLESLPLRKDESRAGSVTITNSTDQPIQVYHVGPTQQMDQPGELSRNPTLALEESHTAIQGNDPRFARACAGSVTSTINTMWIYDSTGAVRLDKADGSALIREPANGI